MTLFKSLGKVLELSFSDGNKPFPHTHNICVRCRKIIDPDLEILKDLTSEVPSE